MKFYRSTVPMSDSQAREVGKLAQRRLDESRAASKNPNGKQEGKHLRKARAKLNDRRNYHSRYPNSSGGHACKAPGSMKG